ncbi:metabotropic glutamate receptor 8-like [Gordionus sp. m RMFG-2023]|uniref:metabotropic glutamate receptor 8-like n=1 Tax=Gordionus sp. m RMFG-2023 TaxID=3053472 RepID=UPI0031FBBB7D
MIYGSESVLKNFPLTQLLNLKDINIGGLYDIYERDPKHFSLCSNELSHSSLLKSFSIIYIIETFNEKLFRPTYNISIGYFIVPTCHNGGTAQIQCIIKNDIRYKIALVGMIGPLSSHMTSFVSPLLTYYKLPHISPEANSLSLSRKKFNYLFRITSSQISYINALISLLRLFKWNQISIIYSSALNFVWLKDQLKAASIYNKFCIWHEIEIYTTTENEAHKKTFKTLMNNTRAKVVFLFIEDGHFEYVLKSIYSINPDPELIFVGIDTWPATDELIRLGLAKILEGAITVFEFSSDLTHYSSWLLNSKKTSKALNPWSFSNKNGLFHYKNDNNFSDIIDMVKSDKRISLSMDATMAFLYSIEALIKDKCQHINKSQIKNCIVDNNLKNYLQNLSFYGMSGQIHFGVDQTANNPLKIGNFLKLNSHYDVVNVGSYNMYDTENGDQLKLITKFKWRNYTFYNDLTAPSSSCSTPCKIDEYPVTTSSVCCWICRRCFERTIFTPSDMFRSHNYGECIACPNYKWPNLNRTVLMVALYLILGNNPVYRVENIHDSFLLTNETKNISYIPFVNEYCSPYPMNSDYLIIELCFQALILLYLIAQTIQINQKFIKAYA